MIHPIIQLKNKDKNRFLQAINEVNELVSDYMKTSIKTLTEFKELTSYTFGGLVHPDDIKRVQWEIHSQVKESDRNMDYIRYRIIRKDGEIRWIDDVGHLEASEYIDGPKMFYVFILDVTDEMTEAEKEYLIAESERFNKQ